MIAKVVAKFDAVVAKSRLEVRLSTVKLGQDMLDASALRGDVCVLSQLLFAVAFALSSFVHCATFLDFRTPSFCLTLGEDCVKPRQ